jgi:PAS domain S-box-containing protein
LDQLVTQRTAELQSANEQLKREIVERMQAEQALRLSEERFSKAFKSSPIPLAIHSLIEGQYVDANQGFLTLTGYQNGEIIGHSPRELGLWDDPAAESAMLQKLRAEMSVRNLPCRFRGKDRRLLDIRLSAEVIELDGKPFLLTIAEDITGQIKLENQLRQAQKMEAVGQLAAGVAHDFNNLLTVVQGNASLLMSSKSPNSEDYKPLASICAASDRASKLVRQLLTFSRKQLPELRPVNLPDVLSNLAEMLPRVLTELIAVHVHAAPRLPPVQADSAMLETVLMNLAVNSRDAMPEGGALTLTVEAVDVTAEAVRANAEAREGRFVRLSVSDTGHGIPADVLPRIFEPFFTTKPPGKGTGLGLAMVYGIVKQHQGWIEIETQIGRGTTFHVFIPAITASPSAPKTVPVKTNAHPVHETILVVEDEPDLRDLVTQVLESRGYRVIAAGSGTEALACWAARKQEIHLLLTDIVMPDGLTGQKLAEQLTNENPQLRVIFTSGYSPGMPGSELADIEEENFLAKPYRPAKLLQVVRECLDRVPAPCAV